MANIKKGDLVQLMTGGSQERGGDRGKQGKVIAVDKKTNRVLVEGLNLKTKHVKAGQTDRGSKTGGIETVEGPIHISNVQLVDPSTKKPTRLGVKVRTVKKTVAGKDVVKTVRVRVAKKSGKEL
jgi:large subunit ribosomal protein L24